MFPALHSESTAHSWTAPPGAVQVLSVWAMSTSTHALPAVVSQAVSLVHLIGHCGAAMHALPAAPKSQHICPFAMSQSWSEVQSRSHVP